jgi:membrane-associated phospholipid phosphatase
LILAYCFGVFFSIVYLGEHYVTDAIAGVMYAGAAYALVRYLSQRRAAQEQERGRTTAVSGAAS